jgi:hypothetical protein
MVVLVVVLVLAGAVGAVAYSLHHTRDDVEPTEREFAEFREAISRQVDGLHGATIATAQHGEHPRAADTAPPRSAGTPSDRG